MDNLPIACQSCAPFGGAWAETTAGVKRCTCPRGQALRMADKSRANPQRLPPVLTKQEVAICLEMLAALPFFPLESGARVAIGDEISFMCRDFSDACWLSQRMVRLYPRWPGAPELRLVYCSARMPLDGVQPLVLTSETFPDGIPSEDPAREAAQLENGMKRLPAGVLVSAAPSLERAVLGLAAAKDLNRGGPRPRVPDVPLVRDVPPEKRITQADIDRAVEELHAKRARKELGLDE